MALGFASQLRRELLVTYRNRGAAANPLLFFVLVGVMVPLGITPEATELQSLSAGMIWVMALLASLLSMEGLFSGDHQDGALEQLLVCPQPMYWSVLAKIVAHWLASGLPLALLSPLLGLMLALPEAGYLPLMASLLVGSGCLSLIGAVGAALTVSVKGGGLLIALLVMPLYVPVLIFGTSVVHRAIVGMSYGGPLAVLAALLLLMSVLCPLASAAALRLAR